MPVPVRPTTSTSFLTLTSTLPTTTTQHSLTYLSSTYSILPSLPQHHSPSSLPRWPSSLALPQQLLVTTCERPACARGSQRNSQIIPITTSPHLEFAHTNPSCRPSSAHATRAIAARSSAMASTRVAIAPLHNSPAPTSPSHRKRVPKAREPRSSVN